MSIKDEHDMIDAAIARFPSTFGLKAFGGDVFRLSASASFVADDRKTVMLYTQRRQPDGTWLDFAKGDEAELRRALVERKPDGKIEDAVIERATRR